METNIMFPLHQSHETRNCNLELKPTKHFIREFDLNDIQVTGSEVNRTIRYLRLFISNYLANIIRPFTYKFHYQNQQGI